MSVQDLLGCTTWITTMPSSIPRCFLPPQLGGGGNVCTPKLLDMEPKFALCLPFGALSGQRAPLGRSLIRGTYRKSNLRAPRHAAEELLRHQVVP